MAVEALQVGEQASSVERIRAISDGALTAEAQWNTLLDVGYPGQHAVPDYVDALFALAQGHAEPEAGEPTSMLVRAVALERAVDTMWQELDADPSACLRMGEDSMLLYRTIEEETPEYFAKFSGPHLVIDPLSHSRHDVDSGYFRREAYMKAARDLAVADGIPVESFDPPYYYDDADFSAPNYHTPMLTFYLMDRIAGNNPYYSDAEGALVPYMSPAVLRDMFRMVLSTPDQRPEGRYEAAVECSRLARASKRGGDDHMVPIDAMYARPAADALPYMTALNGMYDVMSGLGGAFPEAFRPAVPRMAQALMANGLYAVDAHLASNKQLAVDLLLLSGTHIRDTFTGDEPLALMQASETKLDRALRRIMNPDADVMEVFGSKDSALFEFQDQEDPDPLQVLLYIRPEGGYSLDPKYEYGNPHRGVEASIEIRIDDAPTNPYNPYTKYAQSAGALSIRLDREGRDPARSAAIADRDVRRQQGTVSLDIGSIMSGGIGLFYAAGNQYRAAALGLKPDYNHVTDGIDQRLGDADVFAAIARDYRDQFMARSINVS